MRRDHLEALQEQKKHLIHEMRSLSSAAEKRSQNGQWTAEDEQTWDRLGAQVRGINSKLEKQTTMSSLDPGYHAVSRSTLAGSEPYVPSSYKEFRSTGRFESTNTNEYAHAFWKYFTTVDPAEIGADLLVELRTMSKGTNTAGGYLVPMDVSSQVLSAARAAGPMQAVSRTFTTQSGDEFRVPVFNPHGSASWLAESAAYSASDETVNIAALQAYKAGTLIILTEELLADSEVDLSSYLGDELGQRIGQLAESAFMVGDGTGKPLGVSTSGNGITTYTLPAGQVSTLTYAAWVDAIGQLPIQYRKNAALLVSDSLYLRFLRLTDSNGQPIFNLNISQAGPDTFLGYPIYVSPDLPAVGANARAAVFGDFNLAYIIRRVNGVYVQRLNELYAANGQIGFRAFWRVDGRVGLTDAARVLSFAAT